MTVIHLYEHGSACVRCSSRTEAVVADSCEEDGHRGKLRTWNPFLVSYREGEDDEKDRNDKINILFEVVPANVGLCLLHIEARFKTCQQRRQGPEVLPGLEKVKTERRLFFSWRIPETSLTT